MGAGGYYDAHSEYQRRVIEAGDELIRSMMEKVELDSVETFTIADYGAGTGATSAHAVKGAIGVLRERNRDLPGPGRAQRRPDQRLLAALPQRRRPGRATSGLEGGPIYPAAAAGSFFGQVLPSGAVHAGMCSNAMHWLREQPRVAGSRTACTSPTPSGQARAQSSPGRPRRDWEAFLAARGSRARDRRPLMLVQGIGSTVSASGEAEASAVAPAAGHVEGGRRARRGRAA